MREKLLIMRKRAGYTQEQLAEKVGISRNWLCMIENGTVPLNPTIEKALCFILKCKSKDLKDLFEERFIGEIKYEDEKKES